MSDLPPRVVSIDSVIRDTYVPAMTNALGREVRVVLQDGMPYRRIGAGDQVGTLWRFELPGTDPLISGAISVLDNAAERSTKDVGSFARSLQHEVKDLVYDWERALEAQKVTPDGGGDITALPLQPRRTDTYVTHPDYGILNSDQATYVTTCERDGTPVDQRELARRETW